VHIVVQCGWLSQCSFEQEQGQWQGLKTLQRLARADTSAWKAAAGIDEKQQLLPGGGWSRHFAAQTSQHAGRPQEQGMMAHYNAHRKSPVATDVFAMSYVITCVSLALPVTHWAPGSSPSLFGRAPAGGAD